MRSSNTFQCFAMGPSLESSNALLFKPLLLNLYLLEVES